MDRVARNEGGAAAARGAQARKDGDRGRARGTGERALALSFTHAPAPTLRSRVTHLGLLAANPIAVFVVGAYGVLWFLFERETFDWHAVATLAIWFMTLFIQRVGTATLKRFRRSSTNSCASRVMRAMNSRISMKRSPRKSSVIGPRNEGRTSDSARHRPRALAGRRPAQQERLEPAPAARALVEHSESKLDSGRVREDHGQGRGSGPRQRYQVLTSDTQVTGERQQP